MLVVFPAPCLNRGRLEAPRRGVFWRQQVNIIVQAVASCTILTPDLVSTISHKMELDPRIGKSSLILRLGIWVNHMVTSGIFHLRQVELCLYFCSWSVAEHFGKSLFPQYLTRGQANQWHLAQRGAIADISVSSATLKDPEASAEAGAIIEQFQELEAEIKSDGKLMFVYTIYLLLSTDH